MQTQSPTSLLKPLLLGLLVTFAMGCKDDDDHHHDHGNKATITLASPTEGQEFASGDTVRITGNIVTEQTMHGYGLYIRAKNQTDTLYKISGHEHGTTAAINQKWVPNLSGHTELELEVKVTLDHEGNTASKKVTFHAE